ncbi:caspase-1-like isoform X2 [Penaeus japonicus]|nr:caspase-1-like isoform X2 [Penaeus japonicus]
MTLFKNLGFIIKVHIDLLRAEVIEIISDLASDMDHSNCDALVIVFMSHGEEDCLYARDEKFQTDLLFKPFEGNSCESLIGKPKLFFIQADRGLGLEEGVKLQEKRILHTRNSAHGSTSSEHLSAHVATGTDGTKENKTNNPTWISSTADFLVCWSTVHGYHTWRNTIHGSQFVQCLVSVLTRDSCRDDLFSNLTSAIRKMMSFSSNCPGCIDMHKKKQTPCFTSTLLRSLYLYPKPTYPNLEAETKEKETSEKK